MTVPLQYQPNPPPDPPATVLIGVTADGAGYTLVTAGWADLADPASMDLLDVRVYPAGVFDRATVKAICRYIVDRRPAGVAVRTAVPPAVHIAAVQRFVIAAAVDVALGPYVAVAAHYQTEPAEVLRPPRNAPLPAGAAVEGWALAVAASQLDSVTRAVRARRRAGGPVSTKTERERGRRV